MTLSTQCARIGVAAVGLMLIGQSAHALELNGKGSSAGRNFAAQVTGSICDQGTPATYFFNNAAVDPSLPSTRSEWRCKVGSVDSVFRYHGTASLDGFSSLNNVNVQLNTAGYWNTASGCVALPNNAPPNNNPRAFGGHPNVTLMNCTSPALFTNLPIHYGASDTQGGSFTQSGFGTSVNPPVIAAGVDLSTVPVVTVPFAIVVGAGVLKSTGPNVQIDNMTMRELISILSGTTQDWTTLGFQTDTGGQTAITVCHRTPGSGTLATIDQTIMRKGPAFINGTRTPPSGNPVLGSYGNLGNASSGDVLNCMNNASGVNPNHRMSIGYIDSDSVPLLSTGAHQIKIDGAQVNDPLLPLTPTTNARLKDLRCGRYPYWANWNVIVRTNGVDGVNIQGGGSIPAGTQALLDAYLNAAFTTNPLPGYWALQSDMFVNKNDDAGPITWLGGGETFCRP